jgi:amidase
VRDTAALLDFVGGSDVRSLFGFGAGGSKANRNLNMMLSPLKVGIARTMGGVEAHAECQRAIDAAIPMLRELGFQVSEGTTPLFSQDDRETRILLSKVYARQAFCSFEQLVGRKIKRDEVEPFVWDSARPDEAGPSAEEFLAAFERRRAWAAEAMSWWNDNDLLLTPTVCEPPVTIESRANETLEQTHVTEARQMAFCGPFDETGQPSISLPLHWTADGLPVGIQLVADMGRDDLLLAVASRLETMMPWSHKQPPAAKDIAQSVKGAEA